MNAVLSNSVYFGLGLTLLIFFLADRFLKRFPIPCLNSILLSTILIIIILVVCKIDYETYDHGASWITSLLTPATICYAVPLYRQLQVLKKNLAAIIFSVLCGSLSSVLCVFLFSKLFGFDHTFYVSVLPKSVTTAIGIGIAQEAGGIIAITVTSIMISGLFGGLAAVGVCRLLRLTHPVAKGLAIGTASHAVGTAKAIEIGEVEGAMSGLAIVIAGLATVLWCSFATGWI